MKFEGVTQEHIFKAIEHIKKYGYPKNRRSIRHFLEYEGKLYPHKYVLFTAYKIANGIEPPAFKSKESRPFLRSLGFKIVSK